MKISTRTLQKIHQLICDHQETWDVNNVHGLLLHKEGADEHWLRIKNFGDSYLEDEIVLEYEIGDEARL